MTITAAWVDHGSTYMIVNKTGDVVSSHPTFNDAINALQVLSDDHTLVQTSKFKKGTLRWPIG